MKIDNRTAVLIVADGPQSKQEEQQKKEEGKRSAIFCVLQEKHVWNVQDKIARLNKKTSIRVSMSVGRSAPRALVRRILCNDVIAVTALTTCSGLARFAACKLQQAIASSFFHNKRKQRLLFPQCSFFL